MAPHVELDLDRPLVAVAKVSDGPVTLVILRCEEEASPDDVRQGVAMVPCQCRVSGIEDNETHFDIIWGCENAQDGSPGC